MQLLLWFQPGFEELWILTDSCLILGEPAIKHRGESARRRWQGRQGQEGTMIISQYVYFHIAWSSSIISSRLPTPIGLPLMSSTRPLSSAFLSSASESPPADDGVVVVWAFALRIRSWFSTYSSSRSKWSCTRCMRRYFNLQREVGYTVGSLAEAFGPAALRFLRPIRVVGCGGGSYLGFSFYGWRF